jgi:hypothetical protein
VKPSFADIEKVKMIVVSLLSLCDSAILRVPSGPVKCGQPFEVAFVSDTAGSFALSLVDPSTHLRWLTAPPQSANAVGHFTVPCHFLSDTAWLLLAEDSALGISASANVRLFEPPTSPQILTPPFNFVLNWAPFELRVSMPAFLLGAVPHALVVRVRISPAGSSAVLFEDSISLLGESRIEYSGPPCESCILSVVPAWNQSLVLSQPISIRGPELSPESEAVQPTSAASQPPPAPTATPEPADPNKSPLVMAVGIGFIVIGPVCIGLFFYINRRTANEGDPSMVASLMTM